jgi:hypothetical protein
MASAGLLPGSNRPLAERFHQSGGTGGIHFGTPPGGIRRKGKRSMKPISPTTRRPRGQFKTARLVTLIAILALVLQACIPGAPTNTPTPIIIPATDTPVVPDDTPTPPPTDTPQPTDTPAATPTPEATDTPAPSPTPPATDTPAVTPTVDVIDQPEEIFIRQPGPGSRVTSPVTVAGMADSTFEQNLVITIIFDDGTELLTVPTTIQSELGQRGPYSIDIDFEVSEERQAFIQVYSTSARDGGITHLNSVGVTLAPSGAEDIRMVDEHPERLTILQPQNASTVSGGVVQVEGFGLASFEQTLVIEVLDEDGNVLASTPVMVDAPDLGMPGPFSAELTYAVSASMPGRVVVIDPSAAHGGPSHLSSVEVTLQP